MLINEYSNITDKEAKLISTYPIPGKTCIRKRAPAYYL
jgi:hypothetical protein